MKRSILRACALCLTTTFVAAMACAQDDSSTSGGAAKSGKPGLGASRDAYGTPSSSADTTPAGQPVRLSKLMNTSLKNQSGESLGQVQDLVIDPMSGQIQFAVLSLSGTGRGVPGIGTSTSTGIGASTDTSTAPGAHSSTTAGGQLVAIPWRLVSSSGQGQFTASIDRSMLRSAPTFSNSSWPTMDSMWMQSVYSHFGVSPSSTGGPGSSSGTGTGTGLGNPSTPGVPLSPGTPDITPPSGAGKAPSTTPGSGTGIGK